jgi:hypothetical protein
MDIKIRHINRSSIVELIIITNNTTIIETITNLKGKVDENLIESLKNIVNELEEHNEMIKNK